MANMQQKREAALAVLQEARELVDKAAGLMATASQILEEDGGYEREDETDVMSVVLDEIVELEQLVNDYVN